MENTLTVYNENIPAYDIYIRNNYDDIIKALDKIEIKKRRIMIVTDSNVASYYLEVCKEIFREYGCFVHSIAIEAGEANKNLSTVNDCYEELIKQQFDRKDVLVALGGGVVGDLTGFVAATYLRGIRFIQMPTSLLSMVDSSIGGKTGVDFKAYKNMVGAFYQPILVYINIDTLKTLKELEFYSGMSEIIKHGLIRNKSYYTWLVDNRNLIVNKDLDTLTEMILISCKIKKAVVEEDPKEQGIRALLNFGHTIGHSIEKYKNFSLLHGECVSLGMVAAANISYKRGNINEKDYKGIISVLKSFNQPVFIEEINTEDIIDITKLDKKIDSNQIKFILLNEIGKGIIDSTVASKEIAEAIEELKVERLD